jgi:hypothetical protein
MIDQVPMGNKPAFIITIDTEGDNLWSAPRHVTTENSRYIPRFQSICQDYGLKPTYLTDYHMVQCPVFSGFAKKLVRDGLAEIGTHMHAWNTPPIVPLTADDDRFGPYAIEYPADVIRQKLKHLTALLEDRFEGRMTSHRAGRWGFNGFYAETLVEAAYEVDCSVTPGVSWKSSKGNPAGDGGPDFTSAPHEPYYLSLENVCRAGESALLEVPVSIDPVSPLWVDRLRATQSLRSPLRRVLNRVFPPLTWLRPNGRNLRQMLLLLRKAASEGRSDVEFMLHSSEFMPGGSPTFPDPESIECLFADLRTLFALASTDFVPATLTEFAESYKQQTKRLVPRTALS